MNKKENKISKEIKINKKLARKNYSNQTGITLIALVVTIVVLLILAGVSLNAIFSENGIIKRAKDAQNRMNNAQESDLNALNDLDKWIDNQVNGTTGGGTTGGDETPTEKPLITDSSLTSNDRTTSESTTVIAKDKKGNQVVVPGGFKISSASGESVQQGIVI